MRIRILTVPKIRHDVPKARQSWNAIVTAMTTAGIHCWPRANHRGRGYEHFGQMSVSEEALRFLGAQGIHVRESRTRQAVADFNQLKTQRARVVAALHLTC